MDLNIVLVAPEIPHNTGAVGRLCVCLGARLHLVRPLGFSLAERQIKRTGLDYWEQVDLTVHNDWEAFLASAQPDQLIFGNTRGSQLPAIKDQWVEIRVMIDLDAGTQEIYYGAD